MIRTIQKDGQILDMEEGNEELQKTIWNTSSILFLFMLLYIWRFICIKQTCIKKIYLVLIMIN